jgi:hypothetical protein
VNAGTGPLHFTVSLSPSLAAAVESAAGLVSARVAAEIGDLLRGLGIDRRPHVELETSGAATTAPVRLAVESRRCRFAAATIGNALAYVEGTPSVVADPDAAVERLRGLGGREHVAEVVAYVCRAALSAQPGLLADGSDDAVRRAALRLGMSTVRRPDEAAPATSDPVEQLLAASAGETIDVLVEPGSLRFLTVGWAREEMFPFLRDGLFIELGLPLAPFHLSPDASLRPDGFAFRLNAVRTPPQIGLPPGTVLVNDVPDRLSLMNIDAEPTVNPATEQPASIVDEKHVGALTDAGLTTWTPAGFLILCFAAAVRRNAHAMMTRSIADGLAAQLGEAFPNLERAARSLLGIDRLAQLLRELLLDGVPIRNLRRIVELMLRYEDGGASGCHRDLTGFVRAGMADLIAYKLSRGTATLVVYLLDPDLERELAVATDADDDPAAERLSEALTGELGELPATAFVPVLLTGGELRRRLAELVRHEFPRMTVASYADVPSHWNIQPIARIGAR